MKTKWARWGWSLLVFAASFGANPVWPQQFLRAPTGTPTDLVSTRIFIQSGDLSTSAADRQTRAFKVNPNAFAVAFEETARTGNSLEDKNIQKRVRDYFTAAGINLTSENAPRLFFNDRTGTLMVQGTLAQLEAVENAVQALTTRPVQLAIEVRAVETTGKVQNPGLSALLTRLETDDLDLPSALPLQTANRDESIRALRTAVLTQGEFADLLRSAEQAEGVDIIMMPRTVTISGRQVRMAVEEPYIFITDPPIYGSRKTQAERRVVLVSQ